MTMNLAQGIRQIVVPKGSGGGGGGGSPATTPPPEVQQSSVLGVDTTHYALADHTHQSPTMYWPQGAGATPRIVGNRTGTAVKSSTTALGVTNFCSFGLASGKVGTTGDYSTLCGGQENEASANHATVVGGFQNTASGTTAFIGAGQSNIASGGASVVCGGSSNNATAFGAAVVAGDGQNATGVSSFIGGGSGNRASGYASSVPGGALNTASNDYTTVAGGASCTASGIRSACGGGDTNTASGDYSCVPGGRRCTASNVYTFACGYGAVAYAPGMSAYASGYTGTRGEAQQGKIVLRGSTPGAAANETVELKLGDAGAGLTLEGFIPRANTCYGLVLTLSAVQHTTAAARRTDILHALVTTDGGGVVTVDAQSTVSTLQVGASTAYTLTLSAGATPDRIVVTFATGAGVTQAVDVACVVEWSERLYV